MFVESVQAFYGVKKLQKTVSRALIACEPRRSTCPHTTHSTQDTQDTNNTHRTIHHPPTTDPTRARRATQHATCNRQNGNKTQRRATPHTTTQLSTIREKPGQHNTAPDSTARRSTRERSSAASHNLGSDQKKNNDMCIPPPTVIMPRIRARPRPP